MSFQASSRRFLLFVLAAAAAMMAYVAYPGCASYLSAPDPHPGPGTLAGRYYQSAMDFLEKKQRRGELPGLAPGDAGTFAGTWLWFDYEQRYSGHRIRCTFTFADGRPGKRFEMVGPDWQLVPLSKN